MTPRSLGAIAAVVAFAADQAHKYWMLDVFGIAERQPLRITPFFDVVLAWNPGISYSLFSATSATGTWLLLALALAVTGFLAVWLWRAARGVTGLALGLVIGGALGNALDRLRFGAVADFFHFHAGGFSWYIFNVADCAIVAGIALLLYDSWKEPAKKGVVVTEG